MADSRELLRQLLVESNQAMLSELANRNGPTRSVEQVALDVANKFLSQPSAVSLMERGTVKAEENLNKSPAEPQSPKLKDVQAVPWVIWGGSHEDGKLLNEKSHGQDEWDRQVTVESLEESAATMTAGLRLLNTTTHWHTWMKWHRKPESILIVAKTGDREVAQRLREIAIWMDSQGLTVILEPELWKYLRQDTSPTSSSPRRSSKVCWCSGDCACPRLAPNRRQLDPSTVKWAWDRDDDLPAGFLGRCRTWTPGQDHLERCVDLVVCLGGDGTLCWAAGLFSGAMPPVIAFAGGSLGFLTPFPMKEWMSVLAPIVGVKCELRPLPIACRMRFQLRLLRGEDSSGQPSSLSKDESPPIPVQALNEVLVHRGSSGHLVKLEVWVNDERVTVVQGDGLILATPTGSTAYSLSAGGSMMHPAVPGIILTPVCPHSLSFRPIVLPDSAVVTIRVPMSARSSVMIAVDGKDRIELSQSDAIEVAASACPLPTICKTSVTDDWFTSLHDALQWNMRLEQKGLNHISQPVMSEGRRRSKRSTSFSSEGEAPEPPSPLSPELRAPIQKAPEKQAGSTSLTSFAQNVSKAPATAPNSPNGSAQDTTQSAAGAPLTQAAP